MKIRYRRIGDKSVVKPIEILEGGDWIDLQTRIDVNLKKDEYAQIPLGIAMELPSGFEAWVVLRSSTPRKWKLRIPNGKGIVDCLYRGDGDEWHAIVEAMNDTKIPAGTRIAQFRIFNNQFATPWQKIKWMFTRKLEFVEVEVLGNINRGGIGSTGN